MSGVLRAAMEDRTKETCNMQLGSFIKAFINELPGMIRESGDRGTSILNFITNLGLFLAAVSLVLEDCGYSVKKIRK